MLTIHLHQLRFFCYHGLHNEEKKLGAEYEINVDITFNSAEKITHLNQTINYVKVYQLIQQRMNIPTELLETIVQDLAQIIYAANTHIISININLNKLHPPITSYNGNVGVSYKKVF